jgi:hypothetical protein
MRADGVTLRKEESMNLSTILTTAITAILTILGTVWAVTRKYVETAAQKAAEETIAEINKDRVAARSGLIEAAQKAADETIAEINKGRVLARELERIRGVSRQNARVVSYANLWSRMHPTAIYEGSPFNQHTVLELSKSLSEWYFSPEGGLMLTTPCRELYFTFQDLLHELGRGKRWKGDRTADPKGKFREFLTKSGEDYTGALELLEMLESPALDQWPPEGVIDKVAAWKRDIDKIPGVWNELEPQLRFSIVQQVSSVLRTALSADVESRLR